MPNSETLKEEPLLHEVETREDNGRDTISRYQAQYRAAAHKCLALLDRKSIDRVYCDFQDDFVTRHYIDSKPIYNFFQVKTKDQEKYQWDMNEILGLYKKHSPKSEKILKSFAGKLLLHTINFRKSCGSVMFLTNVHINDDVEEFIKAKEKKDPQNRHYKQLLDNFNSAFDISPPLDEAKIIQHISKLSLDTNVHYLSPEDTLFHSIARGVIYQYSEIDLRRNESEEIVNNLLQLVEKKSFKKLVANISEEELDDIAGIGILDMLEVLSLSKKSYTYLIEGGDSSALKSVSVIQSLLSQSGASERMIEYVSKCKIHWDNWYRQNRHSMAEFDLVIIQEKIEKIATELTSQRVSIPDLDRVIKNLLQEINNKKLSQTLDENLLLGAVFSSIVRNEAV